MVRERSRSRERERERRRRSRSRSTGRTRTIDKDRVRRRSQERRRSRTPVDRRRSRSRERLDERRRHDNEERSRRDREKEKQTKDVGVDSLKGLDKDMLKLMGFAGFDTTKNKKNEWHVALVITCDFPKYPHVLLHLKLRYYKVPGNVDGVVSINKPRRYRQYMNRKGGFNRPLDYVA